MKWHSSAYKSNTFSDVDLRLNGLLSNTISFQLQLKSWNCRTNKAINMQFEMCYIFAFPSISCNFIFPHVPEPRLSITPDMLFLCSFIHKLQLYFSVPFLATIPLSNQVAQYQTTTDFPSSSFFVAFVLLIAYPFSEFSYRFFHLIHFL